jgi:hypothetical protein
MTVERLADLVAFRSRIGSLPFGGAVGEPVFRGTACGLATFGTLAGDPEVYDLSHTMLEGRRSFIGDSRFNCPVVPLA